MEKTLSKAEITRLSEKGIEVTEYIGSGASSDVFAIAPYKGNERLCIKYFYDCSHKAVEKEYERYRKLYLMETAADSYGMSDHVSGAKTGTAEMVIDGTETGQANMAAYDETYIVVVSKNGSDFGISNKDVIEKLFNKLDDIR